MDTQTKLTALRPALAAVDGFAPDSRVWIYLADRPLSDQEAAGAQESLNTFVRQWTAHNQALKAAAEVSQRQFIVLMVDETQAGASGCSIDKSVHFLEQLGLRLGVDLFERMRFAWVKENTLQFASRDDLHRQVRAKEIADDTLMINTMVQNKRELAENWFVPFARSWHRRLL